jgi:hypothetical protein
MQFVGDKVAYALAQGLKVVTACVGETPAANGWINQIFMLILGTETKKLWPGWLALLFRQTMFVL